MMLNYMHDYHELNAGIQYILMKAEKLFNNWNSNLIYYYANLFYEIKLQQLIQESGHLVQKQSNLLKVNLTIQNKKQFN